MQLPNGTLLEGYFEHNVYKGKRTPLANDSIPEDYEAELKGTIMTPSKPQSRDSSPGHNPFAKGKLNRELIKDVFRDPDTQRRQKSEPKTQNRVKLPLLNRSINNDYLINTEDSINNLSQSS